MPISTLNFKQTQKVLITILVRESNSNCLLLFSLGTFPQNSWSTLLARHQTAWHLSRGWEFTHHDITACHLRVWCDHLQSFLHSCTPIVLSPHDILKALSSKMFPSLFPDPDRPHASRPYLVPSIFLACIFGSLLPTKIRTAAVPIFSIYLLFQIPKYTYGKPHEDYLFPIQSLLVIIHWVDFFIIHSPDQYFREKNGGQRPKTFFERFIWVWHLNLTLRGIGWNWQVKNVREGCPKGTTRWEVENGYLVPKEGQQANLKQGVRTKGNWKGNPLLSLIWCYRCHHSSFCLWLSFCTRHILRHFAQTSLFCLDTCGWVLLLHEYANLWAFCRNSAIWTLYSTRLATTYGSSQRRLDDTRSLGKILASILTSSECFNSFYPFHKHT